MLMGIYLKASGNVIKLMAKEYISMSMEQDMKVNGRMIFNMDMALKLGMMGLNMKEIMLMGRSKAKEHILGLMGKHYHLISNLVPIL